MGLGWFSLLFALLLTIVASDDLCPRKQDLYPCTCEKGTTTCSRLHDLHVLRNVFRRTHDFPFVRFVLKESHVPFLPSMSLLRDKRVTGIRIENCSLISLFDHVPRRFRNDELSDFKVFDSKIMKGVHFKVFKNFKNLTILEFEGVEIRKVGSEFRENIQPDIEHVHLARTRRSIVLDRAFDRLTKLKWVGVTGGRTSVLKRSMFSKVTSIKFMDFSGNRISTLPTNMFDHMPKLTFINLENNLFTSLSEKIFGNMFLQDFKMNMLGNKFICDCSIRWFAMHEKFYVIGMCANPPAVAGKELKDLMKKDFDYCKI